MLNKFIFAAAIGGLVALPAAAYADAAAEIATAAQHAGFAAAAPNLAQSQTHLHHVVNCIEGAKGADYDPKNMNPCAKSGDGAIPDEADAATKAKLQSIAATAEDGIKATDPAVAKKDAADAQTALQAIK
jgi:hypothetical protein